MNILTIAGSDPSSGAGIQGDLKTFGALGVYGLTVVTAVTSQSSSKFFRTEPVSPRTIRDQIRAIVSDFKISAIKIGMIYDKGAIRAVYGELRKTKIPIVLDPVFKSSTGGTLLKDEAFPAFKKLMIPLAHVITPNVPEAERIAGIRIRSVEDAKKAAVKIQSTGARNVVIKGGHLAGASVTDLLLEGRQFFTFTQRRIARESHGGGCLFSAALCTSIARGTSLAESVRLAQEISFKSIRDARRFGGGIAIAVQGSLDPIERSLSMAIRRFCGIDGVYRHIPEVQTNFVYSKVCPRNPSDIMGLEGRIVRTGGAVCPVGDLKYGASRHVASAVLAVASKFPSTRSAVNIRFDEKTIERATDRKFRIAQYDRRLEPRTISGIEGRTVSWGVRKAVSKMRLPPDLVYHRGGEGKEPMILLFGRNPSEVISKLAKIA